MDNNTNSNLKVHKDYDANKDANGVITTKEIQKKLKHNSKSQLINIIINLANTLDDFKKQENMLGTLIADIKPQQAPVKTERFGEHYEFIIGIGKDETASVTMTKEAFDALKMMQVVASGKK